MATSLKVLGYFIVLLSAVPLIRKDYWTFRVVEYPRLQKLFLTLVILGLSLWLIRFNGLWDYVFLGALVINTVYLSCLVYPFTPLAPKRMLSAPVSDEREALSLLVSNVYQYNRHAGDCLNLYKRVDPDMILLLETDQWWVDQLKELEASYPYRLLNPLENTYGIALYSRLPLSEEKIRFVVEDDIPSVYARVTLRSGQLVQFFGLHPTPPVPQENPRSTERDKEILLIGKEAKSSTLPVIVAGDLNDVAWSYTTDLFLKTSGLLDPRMGRGFFNTFDARYPLFRYPLDHVFTSNDFTLVDLKRLPNCGSDHFPMYIKVQYNRRAKMVQEEPEAEPAEQELAEEKIKKPV
ncbi:MAG TPA: endonuclease/exonuclease/phosphatase family protein [Sphingobacteriaceae bacterium]